MVPQTDPDEKQKFMEALKASDTYESFVAALRRYTLYRLQLPPETKEANLYRLVVYSVKLRMPGVDAAHLEERLATTDCHQTSYVVSRKNLLMMEIEHQLNATLQPQELDHIETLDDYAASLWGKNTHDR